MTFCRGISLAHLFRNFHPGVHEWLHSHLAAPSFEGKSEPGLLPVQMWLPCGLSMERGLCALDSLHPLMDERGPLHGILDGSEATSAGLTPIDELQRDVRPTPVIADVDRHFLPEKKKKQSYDCSVNPWSRPGTICMSGAIMMGFPRFRWPTTAGSL